MTVISLNCLVRGQDPCRCFIVEIDRTERASFLREIIKEKKKPEFDHIPADGLLLCKASIPIQGIEEELEKFKNLSPDDLQGLDLMLLMAWDKLGDIFPGTPKKQHVHILIDPHPDIHDSELVLNCLVRGEDPSHSFTINIDRTTNVSVLRKAIKAAKKNQFQHVDADSLVLWNVESHEEDLEIFDPHNEEPLFPLNELSDVFSEVPSKEDIHILVEPPSAKSSRAKYLHTFPKIAPSSGAVPSTFSKHQKNEKSAIYCNRPPSASATISPILLHPIFGRFVDDCATYRPTWKDHEMIVDLSARMSNYYLSDNERRAEFIDASRLRMIPAKINGHFTDENFQTNGHHYLIIEVKDEICSSSSEPWAQAMLRYVESTENNAKMHLKSTLPCILLVLIGPHVGFAAAVWSDERPVVEPLSAILPLNWHHTDIRMRMMAVRHFGALNKALDSLRHYYENGMSSQINTRFPYRTYFTGIDSGKEYEFKYVTLLTPSKMSFLGKIGDDDFVYIKFVHSYSLEVHKFCVSNGYSPLLRGYDELPGGWKMVTMDYVEGNYVDFHETYPSRRLIKEIQMGIQKIHEAGYVHGDIRDTNFMVEKNEEDRFMLIDFELAGKIGEAFYPINMTGEFMPWRPDGARDGELITVEHDDEMLEHMFKSNHCKVDIATGE